MTMKNTRNTGHQMTIFDLLPRPSWTEMTLKQLAAYISEKTGLLFIPDTRFHGEYSEYIAYYTSCSLHSNSINLRPVTRMMASLLSLSGGRIKKKCQAVMRLAILWKTLLITSGARSHAMSNKSSLH